MVFPNDMKDDKDGRGLLGQSFYTLSAASRSGRSDTLELRTSVYRGRSIGEADGTKKQLLWTERLPD
jgi:hypothetical protein